MVMVLHHFTTLLMSGCPKMVSLLVDAGVDVDAKVIKRRASLRASRRRVILKVEYADVDASP